MFRLGLLSGKAVSLTSAFLFLLRVAVAEDGGEFEEESSEEAATEGAPSILLFLGRFHPLVVHLPIGILFLLFLLELLRFKKEEWVPKIIVKITLLAALGSSVLAIIAGYFLSLGGGYDENLLELHEHSGQLLAVFTAVSFIIFLLQESLPKGVWVYRISLFVILICLTVVGHYGGSLTHGSEYLTEYMPFKAKEEEKKISDINEAILYADVIQPIFNQKCTSCHNIEKRKGELRLDSYEEMFRGGENGPVVVAGKPDESHLFKLITLDPANEDAMPPKGKTPLTSYEVKLIHWWISTGGLKEKKVAELQPSEDMKKVLKTYLKTEPQEKPYIFTVKVEPANEDLLNKAKAAGILAVPLAKNKALLSVSFQNAEKVKSARMKELEPFKQQITFLDLSGTAINDSAAAIIATFPNITKLYLQNTAVTSKALEQLAKLQHLEYLNIYGTKVSDEGLGALKNIKTLKRLYLWQTDVSENAIKELQKALPNLEVIRGMKSPS